MRLAIAGAAGRMGRVLTRVVHEMPGCTVVGGIEAKGSPHLGHDMGDLAGLGAIGAKVSDDAAAVISAADGVIDFTVPQATLALAKHTSGKVHVIGTTGIDEAGEAVIREAAKTVRIVKSGNMSVGLILLAELVKQAAASLAEDFDIEVLEMHHRQKIDAPSGTALLLADSAAKGRGIGLNERSIRTRDGHTGARPSGDIGFATLRGGTVVGEHSVIFAGASERIEFTHKAESRDLFARGAARAALWAAGQKPGLYSMRHVLGLE